MKIRNQGNVMEVFTIMAALKSKNITWVLRVNDLNYTNETTVMVGPNSTVDIVINGELGTLEWRYYSGEDIKVTLNDSTVETYPQTPGSEYRQHVMAALETRLINPDTLICDLNIAGEQTLWNNGAYESSAVNQLNETDFTVDDDGERIKVEINNISDIIDQSFEQGKMFSELNVPWAVKGTEVDLSSYKQFDGGKI
ncbi:MAG: hypothetical protein L3J71_17885 [Victivallaceae bacterium]|nr:hypothetical protein [Victivallaceae bacterium]